jgi:hypothetical protein
LKEADKATGLLEVSMTGLVFMVAAGFCEAAQSILEEEVVQIVLILVSSAHIGFLLSQNC